MIAFEVPNQGNILINRLTQKLSFLIRVVIIETTLYTNAKPSQTTEKNLCKLNTYPTTQYRHRDKYLTYECNNTGKQIATKKVDKFVWDWLVGLLSDSSNLEAGLQDMINNREDEIEQKRERFDVLDNLIHDLEKEIKFYIEELPNHTTEIAQNSFREKIDNLSKNHNSLIEEKDKLEQEILHSEVSPEEREVIFSLADEVCKGITNSTYEDKRYLLDTLDVQLEFYWDDSGNWVSASCAIPTFNETIVLSPSMLTPGREGG